MQHVPFSALATVYDAIMADIEYDDWADFVLNYARDQQVPVTRVLDLACGTGAMTAEFDRRGLNVTGLDGSAEMLAVARARLPQLGFVQADLRDFELGMRFDLITCVFDSLNNLTEPADLGRALARMRAHLKPGGLLAFDVNTRLGVRELWDGEAIEGVAPLAEGREVHYHWSHHYDAASELGTVQAFCRVVDDSGEAQEFVELHTERGYDPSDLAPLLEAAGFASWEALEYPDYAEPWPETPRIWVFARAEPS
ncbi:class I SAM-dependent DNA methyltransferase [Deinococcus sonorensis]|uniref:Methyltransferase domain-containing protein n=2 Tax=Deinococcus sonorensis TaxID=309891 RepID=A0AAU7U7G2_9DEIO